MSTIKVDTIQKTGGASAISIDTLSGVTTAGAITITLENSESQILQKGLAKVTANVRQGGANEANSNLNISSVADGGTGLNTINAANAFSAALAAVALGTIHDGSYNRGINIDNTSTSAFVTRAFTSSSGALVDADSDTSVAIFGDLA